MDHAGVLGGTQDLLREIEGAAAPLLEGEAGIVRQVLRPEIAGEPLDLTGYTKIYVGYPIWCAEEPRIMDTFAESCDFSGLTVIPFCTSGSSGIGKSGKNLAEKAGSGTWLDGKRFPGGATEADVQKWIESLGEI